VGTEGGTVSNNNGSVTIALPLGSLETGSSIGITSEPDKTGVNFAIGANTGNATAYYEFTPDGITFGQPVIVTMIVTCTKNCDKLAIWIYTEGVGWEELVPTTCVNLGSNLYECSATTTHFTPFALFVPADTDDDGVVDSWDDVKDNCPTIPNLDQSDTYPPQGNSCGNACECEGNFDGDLDQDGSDAFTFKQDFGRGRFNNPCTNVAPCNGDLTCDGDVDGSDAFDFKQDFGRGTFNRPCPDCETIPWCVYP
jgi:hypothetical protein